jgi:hypothetical protein
MWEEIKGNETNGRGMKIEGAGRKESLGKFNIPLKGTNERMGKCYCTVPSTSQLSHRHGMAWHGISSLNEVRR